jgi:hypothetical protein
LDDISDVDTPAPTDGYVLTWSDVAGAWIAQSPLANVALDGLSDVVADLAPAEDELLAWDQATLKWVNQTHAEAGVPSVSADAYTPTNVTPDYSFDATTVGVTELAHVVGTLIASLQAAGMLQ